MISQEQPPADGLDHPGEIVMKVQERARKVGVEPRYWKTISRMDASSMEQLMQRHIPQYAAAIIINACGDVQVSPTPRQAGNAVVMLSLCRSKSRTIAQPRRNEAPTAARGRERLRHIIRLVVKPSGPQEDLMTD